MTIIVRLETGQHDESSHASVTCGTDRSSREKPQIFLSTRLFAKSSFVSHVVCKLGPVIESLHCFLGVLSSIMGCSIRLVSSWSITRGMNAPLKGTPGASWGSAVSPSITRRKSSVSNLFECISSVSECVSTYTAVFQVWERLKALSGSLLCRWAPVAPTAWAPVHGVTETSTTNPLLLLLPTKPKL